MLTHSPLSSAFVFPSGYVSYNARGGYRKFDGIKEYEYIERNGFFIFGGAAGVRVPLKKYPRLRLQPAIEVGWGGGEEQVIEDALIFSDGRVGDAHERIDFFTFGTQIDAHILFPTSDINRMLYLSGGAGLHRNTFYDFWETSGGREVSNTKSNKMRTVGFSLNAGGGVEWRISRERAVAVGYNFRFWDPIVYNDYGDMFPMGAEYTEYFYSHSIQLHILLPRSMTIGFR